MKIHTKDYVNTFQLICVLLGSANIIGLLYLNHEFTSIEFYNIFIKKRPKRKKKPKIEEKDTTEEDLIELLKEENIDKFLNECKEKYKNSSKGFFQFLMDDQESVEDIFFRDLEFIEANKNQDEIEEILEKRIKNKYYRDLAKIIIVTRLVNNKANKLKETYMSEEIEEEYEEDDEPYFFDNTVSISNNNKDCNDNNSERNNNEEFLYLERSYKRILLEFLIFVIDTLFSYATLVLLLLFITHLDKNLITVYGYYIINFLLLMKVRNY